MKFLSLVFFLSIFISCNTPDVNLKLEDKINGNLTYFGWSLVDTYFDDPTDSEEKSNYVDEIAPFSNVGDILPSGPNDDIRDRLETFQAHDVEVMLHVWGIFFEEQQEGGELSGKIWGLNPNYKSDWEEFAELNELHTYQNNLHSFYLGEEPAWNSISEEDFTIAADYLKETFPDVDILMIEAYLALDNMYTPASVDLVGWDHYFVKEPATDEEFLAELTLIENTIQDHQNIYMVMDAHFLPLFHRLEGISKKQLAKIALDYYNIANSNDRIEGILGYHWPSGFELDNAIGARGLPEEVSTIHAAIGKQITGK